MADNAHVEGILDTNLIQASMVNKTTTHVGGRSTSKIGGISGEEPVDSDEAIQEYAKFLDRKNKDRKEPDNIPYPGASPKPEQRNEIKPGFGIASYLGQPPRPSNGERLGDNWGGGGGLFG
jgi:hypothetical protein